MMASLSRMLASIVFIFVSVWLLLGLLLYIFQARFIYFPSQHLELTPTAIGLVYEDVRIPVNQDTSIHGWYIPHADPRATLLFFHGNGGNISHRLDSLQIFHDLGLSVLIVDYEGYGRSDGKPSEQATYRDAIAAREYLLTEKNVTEKEIIYFGRSLGGAVAAWLAAKHPPAILILESTFTSVVDMGRHYYPYLPAGLLTRYRYATDMIIREIGCPLLLIHSPEDDIVPYELGRQLYDLANEPKSFMTINGDHNNGFMLSKQHYTTELERFFDRYLD